MGTARVRLLGEELTLRGEEDAVHLERLASELDVMLKRMANDLNLTSQPTRAALLVAVNLLDELNQLKRKYALLESGTHSAAEQMLKRIEHTLTLDMPEVPVA
jgi:cell division protein ZapA (FtsZ GTPase activity inhibitor)